MRKPAVVVAVAVSAVLAGGVMVATTAGAETHPEVPALPAPGALDVPDLPVSTRFPVRPGGAAPASVSPAPGSSSDSPAAASPSSSVPSSGSPAPGAAPAASPAAASPAAGAGVTREPVVAPAQARPGGHEQPLRAAGGHERPLRAERPQRAVAVQEQPQATTLAAAQRDVTTSQALSADPRGSVQRQALELVNQNRRRGGCGNLDVDRRLVEAANRHAADMARRGYFAHESPNGDRAGERVGDAGYRWKRFGENIARGQDSVYEVVNGWMRSPEHRENIMDCRLHEVGVGLAFSPDRTPYWVQDFATPAEG